MGIMKLFQLPNWLKREQAKTDDTMLPVVGNEEKVEPVRTFYPSLGKDKQGNLVKLTLKRAHEKYPRNKACPCGSGHKYKKCCMVKHEL